ncbi:MAG TPA: winged helix-turn-helix domain-containing protein [Proteobacteria bacterium]|nr:winged helix-turn-helix domain-containing protein [Pseudomonadota bacterium]
MQNSKWFVTATEFLVWGSALPISHLSSLKQACRVKDWRGTVRPVSSPSLSGSVVLLCEVFGISTNNWDGKTLSTFIKQQFRVNLGVRQCQRLFRQLGFRLRKPRPIIAKADPIRQQEHKKNFVQ